MTPALALLALTLPLQDAPRKAAVKAESAELRAGPSDSTQYHVTNTVRRGTTLEVLGEEPGGWLRVKPPPGSVTWINTASLNNTVPGQNKPVVGAAGATIPTYPGSEANLGRRPNVIGARVKPGFIAECIGSPERPDVDGTWVRIKPPPGEVRYVRAAALDGATGSFTPAPGAAASAVSAGALPIARTPSANAAQTADELWRQAHAAHVARRHEEAAKLYEETAEAAKANPALAAHATAQARALRAWLASSAGSSFAPTSAGATLSAPGDTPRAQPVGVFRGTLRRAGWNIDGQRAYFLDVFVQGGIRQPGFYVTAGPGVDLAAFAGRDVELAGTPVYRGELRAHHLVAGRIQLYR